MPSAVQATPTVQKPAGLPNVELYCRMHTTLQGVGPQAVSQQLFNSKQENKPVTNPLRIFLVLCSVFAPAATADDIREARNVLCSIFETTVCLPVEGCVHMIPEELNIPRFIRIDTKTRELSTTPASGENRVSVADSVRRSEGHVILQGFEAGRAYSLLIHEQSGMATYAAAAEGRSVSTFGACTPVTEN